MNSISVFEIIKIDGVRWINNDNMIFCGVSREFNVSFLLWIIEINIINENEVVIRDIKKINIIELLFQNSSLVIIIISLRVLIDGGAEMFKAININHQNVILGVSINIPLNKIMFRVWSFVYKSLTRRNRADDDNPWAIIIMIAPDNPIVLIVNSLVNTNPIWATDE